MPQVDLIRTEFLAKELITSSLASTRQTLAFTGYYQVGDIVDIVSLNACGAIVGTLAADLEIDAIDQNVALYFDASVDTSTAQPSGGLGWYVIVKDIDDGQEAIDRLYRMDKIGGFVTLSKSITSGAIDTPSAGQTTFYVPDINLFKVGDVVTVVSDEGLQGSATILSLAPNADDTYNMATIVVDDNIDVTGLTNIKLSTTVSIVEAVTRLENRIDEIDKPIENEDLDAPNGCMTAFETDNLFLVGSSKVYLDGVRANLGVKGTRATLTNDTSNAQLIFTSMILNTAGNKTKIKLTDPAGNDQSLSMTVTGNFSAGYTIDVSLATGPAGAITSTALDVAALINAHSVAKRLVQVVYGGTGLGVQSVMALTALASGANDATGDYAEIEQVYKNHISATGYKWIAFNIRPDQKNRYKKPPQDSEEIFVDYRVALVNK